MRKFILYILAFLFVSALFSIAVIFLPPRNWDAAVVLFSILLFLNKKTAFVFWITLAAGLFFEIISNTAAGIQIMAIFAALAFTYLLKSQFLKLNRRVALVLDVICATAVYRLSQTVLSVLIGDFSEGFFQTVYDFIDLKMLLTALLWNVFLTVLFLSAYNAIRRKFIERFFIFR